MMFILGVTLGIVIGMFILALISIDKITEMQSLISASRKSLARAEETITERNIIIESQREKIQEQKSKITDLKNNVKILVNNSNDTKLKELVTDYQSEN